MILLLKEFWYKRKAKVYLNLVKKCTEMRRKLNAKQRFYKEKHEEYERKTKEVASKEV